MTIPYKPENHSSVSPYLLVDGAADTLAFLSAAFGATETMRIADGDGRIRHAEVHLDDSVIMVADASDDWPAIAASVHVYVRDVDAVYKRALAAGAESIQEPANRGDTDRRGGVRDTCGTVWWIATRVE